MSYGLYRKTCQWLLEKGTTQHVFAHCFLVLTWNLCCRANKIVNISLNDIQWMDGVLCIYFRHAANDQAGERRTRDPRCIYANPFDPVVSPAFALGTYLANFPDIAANQGKLFPGPNQFHRFSNLLHGILEEHWDEVNAMGIDIDDVGTHSIRKAQSTTRTCPDRLL